LVALTRLILSQPDVWLLDEPTASMDEQAEARCLAVLRDSIGQHQTVVLVTHKPTVLSMVDRIIVLTDKGIVADGRKAEIAQTLQQLLRVHNEASSGPTALSHDGPATAASSGGVSG
jgi:ATP-binding cassette, subfamily C, bacterial LapB